MNKLEKVRREKCKRWAEILAEQSVSGLSIAVFCHERGLNKHTFGYWKKRLGRAVCSASSNATENGGDVAAHDDCAFQEVRLAEPVSASPNNINMIEIALGNAAIRAVGKRELFAPSDTYSNADDSLSGGVENNIARDKPSSKNCHGRAFEGNSFVLLRSHSAPFSSGWSETFGKDRAGIELALDTGRQI